MKKLLLILIFTLSICALGDANKVIKPSKFLLEERIPELSEMMPSEKYLNHLHENAHKTQLEVYRNLNKFDNKKFKRYNEKGNKVKVTYYYSKNKLGKIVKEVIGEKDQKLEIYYLKGKDPFFAIFKYLSYSEIQEEKIEEIIKNQQEPVYTADYYFVDNELFHIFDSEDCGAPWNEDYLKETEKDFREKLNSLISKQ
ncbi:hypothetical protein [Fusobacterium sp. PH5-44]|uniref:hypothetical protein n=1 Tax=unclassified Fusobacterium TaxID=2648384 RepID=UPI003D226815